MHLNFQNYKRIFAFGCSFTSYLWPTWADIIASECNNAKFYNLGKSGSGNLSIACKVAETHNIFNFEKNDLVLIMWSSFTREDRWVGGKWLAAGNVYSNDIYDETFLRKYADPLGYLIRDLGLIYTTHKMLNSLNCDKLELYSYSVKAKMGEGMPIDDINQYKKLRRTYDNFVSNHINKNVSLWDYITKNTFPTGRGHSFVHSYDDKPSYDPHPNTFVYQKYLKHIGLNLSTTSDLFVEDSMKKLKLCNTHDDLINTFPEHFTRQDESYIILM